jgi:predicted nucleic acid-binding Zn ribbon protein
MEYTYKFTTGEQTIEIDEDAYASLQDRDRLDRNNSQTYHRHIVSLEAFGFEPEFMVCEPDEFNEPPSSKAYEYAMKKLKPKQRDILLRWIVKGERPTDIAKSYNVSYNTAYHFYCRAVNYFKQHYKDGLWLFSKENTGLPDGERIKVVPPGLTLSQVMQIRSYRKEHKTLLKIARLVHVRKTQVVLCLKYNPIKELNCLGCGKIIKQDFGQLRSFCSSTCYYQWFRREGIVENTCPTKTAKKEYMTQSQRMIVDFYRQHLLTQKEIRQLTGISMEHISAYYLLNPLTYTHCLYCGKQIPMTSGKRTKKYCSTQCANDYWNHIGRKAKKDNKPPLQSNLPSYEQLEYIIKLRDSGSTLKQIYNLTGVTKDKVKLLYSLRKQSK